VLEYLAMSEMPRSRFDQVRTDTKSESYGAYDVMTDEICGGAKMSNADLLLLAY
jgi:hypothetical protein